MTTAHDLHEAYKALSEKEKIKFERLKRIEDKRIEDDRNRKRLEIANDLIQAGISKEYIVKYIL
jgi:hypothetical protein